MTRVRDRVHDHLSCAMLLACHVNIPTSVHADLLKMLFVQRGIKGKIILATCAIACGPLLLNGWINERMDEKVDKAIC